MIVALKRLNRAKIVKKSLILFWLLNMTILCKHVHGITVTFFNFCATHLPVRLDIETKFPYFLFWTAKIKSPIFYDFSLIESL